MNSKVFIVLLVLVVLAFVGFELMGIYNHSSSGGEPVNAKTFDPSQYPEMSSMNDVLAPFSPKLKLPKTQYILTVQKPAASIEVPADSSNSLRQAKFALSSSDCADLEYSAIGATDELNSQCGPQGTATCHSSNSHAALDLLSASFVVTKGGGTITLERTIHTAGSCKVTLKN